MTFKSSSLINKADMSSLLDYSLLSFDVYGTLIDWESGILKAFEPLLAKDPSRDITSQQVLDAYLGEEQAQQQRAPDMLYSQMLATIYVLVASKLGLPEPSVEESVKFGESVGSWPAFPDTVEALQRLSKTYKLVTLSNVDRKSFEATNSGPLGGVHFDGVLTAQDIGSYKPDPRNFEYMLEFAKSKFGLEKAKILQTAQSQLHDHHPVSKMGIKSVWIARSGSMMGKTAKEIWDWKFDTLGEMADAVDKEREVAKSQA